MIKLPRLHARLPAMHSRLSLGPRRMSGERTCREDTTDAGISDMRAFYEALKAVYGPSHQIQAPLRSLGGRTLLTDKEAILQRWSEHFEGPLQ